MFVSVIVPSPFQMPPPEKEEFPDRVTFVSVIVPAKLKMPPPVPFTPAEFVLRVTLVRVAVPFWL